MTDTDPRLDRHFSQAKRWPEEQRALRDILRDTPLCEEWKWRQPCYTAHGGNIAMIAGYKVHCALSFFKGVLLSDPEGLLVAPGDNSRSVRMLTFHSVDEITDRKPIIRAYLDEAMADEKAGRKVDLPDDDLELAEELAEKIADDARFRDAWEALTPGRRRGYVVTISGAKQSKTRRARIEKFAPRILQGKGLHDR